MLMTPKSSFLDTPRRPLARWSFAFGVLVFVAGGWVRPALAADAPPLIAPTPPAATAQSPDGPSVATSSLLSTPPQAAMVHRRRRGLIIAGATTFAVSWSLAVLLSLTSSSSDCTQNCDSRSAFAIPVVGPAIFAARHPKANGTGLFVVWSLTEAAGAAMLVAGLVGHDVPLQRVSQREPALHVTPMLAHDGGGISLTTRW